MIQRALASKGLVAYVLACATGITLYFHWPFPENDLMLHLISIRAPLIYVGFKYTYTLFLFTTPYIGYSLVLSGLYVFALRPNRKIKPMPLPAYPDPSSRDELFLVLGEVHDPRNPIAAEQPYWLTIPERGLFTGIAIFGAIGTPDRILLGEIRGAEAFDLLQLLNTGHSGTISTVHANSALQAINRFTSCVLQSNVELPYRAIKINITDSLNLLIHIERRPGRRFVSEVLRIAGYDLEHDRYTFDQIFDRVEES
jgi:hypothetical protein